MGGTQRRTHVGTTCKVEETTPGSPGEAREGGQGGGKGEPGGGLHYRGNYLGGLKREKSRQGRGQKERDGEK